MQNSPYIIKETKGTRRFWCACGESKNQPYCDGTHSKIETKATPISVTIEKDAKIAWCGCRKSKNVPYCDGTHAHLDS